ncbi:MAG: UbiA family prenyltransferase [Verrucomicrobia bacterium]|jgi:4-hydroxybenzoate polyprenyltransferase|nr:UbiA family prenyltransferase [Verrucomicrobiota bacterium]
MAWLELMRVPNLPTVPGDPLAGFALASAGQGDVSWWRAIVAVAVALLLYAAGLIWNDCADYTEDCRERPQRPLPSGRISRRQAAAVGAGLAVAGVGLAWLLGIHAGIVATALLLLVVAYNFGSRRIRLLGLFNMGGCRAGSVLLGAAAARSPVTWPPIVFAAAAGIGLYIVGVAWLAVDETEREGRGVNIGLLIRLLIPIQAVLCVAGGRAGAVAGALVLLGWPVSSWLGRRFYAS